MQAWYFRLVTYILFLVLFGFPTLGQERNFCLLASKKVFLVRNVGVRVQSTTN